jgi:hypothetical protein
MMLSVKNNTNIDSLQQLSAICTQAREQFMRAVEQERLKSIPARVKNCRQLANEPIDVIVNGEDLRILPLSLAIRSHDALFVQHLLRHDANIYQYGPNGYCPVDLLNQELQRETNQKFLDIRLDKIRGAMQWNSLWREISKYQFAAIFGTPLLAVSLVYIGHFALFQVYLSAIILFMRNYLPLLSPIFGAAWNLFSFGSETMYRFSSNEPQPENERPFIKRPHSMILQTNQKQIFGFLRYSLYFASYAAIALAMISKNLYGYLLTSAISLEILRQALKLHHLCIMPCLPLELRQTDNEVGAYYNHRANIGKAVIKLTANIAYTAITFAWCFSPSGVLALAYFSTLYITTFLSQIILCDLVDRYMMKKTDQAVDRFNNPENSQITDAQLDTLTHNQMHHFRAALYYYSGLKLLRTEGPLIREIISQSIDTYLINSTQGYFEHTLSRSRNFAVQCLTFWKQKPASTSAETLEAVEDTENLDVDSMNAAMPMTAN